MSNSRDHLEMILKSVECFTEDGKVDDKALDEIVSIAERDGVIDNNEIRVLKNIISKIDHREMDSSMQRKLEEIVKKISRKG